MKRALRYGTFWIGMYVLAVLLPLALVMLGETPPGRTLFVEFAVALGFIGLAMMGFQFALTARFRAIAGTLGMDNMLQFHRQAGIIAAMFVIGHVLVIVVADRQYMEFFDPRVNMERAAALSLVIVLLIALIILTLWRQKFRLPYEWWRLTHGIIGSIILLIGLAHVIMVEYLVNQPWKKAVIIALVVGSLLLLVQARIIKPLLALRKPWRVARVKKEVDRVWTLTFEAVGHEGIRFRPGQCVWVTISNSPYSLAQHPFTIASSGAKPASGQPEKSFELTIKELGDYTAKISSVAVDSRAYVEGPYGAATIDVDCEAPAVFIVGGIGVTPAISMLRTLRELNSKRLLLLIYGCASQDRIIFREELEAMRDELELRITYVLEEPEEDWAGESGFITPELLAKHLVAPFDAPQTQYFLCGPDAMMNTIEPALRDHGVPIHNINSERFQIV